ncbi:hypothetical protein BGW36DRAFT_402030 [Talaromyces proteolyticus]|uniref:Uncharacterized protein n=1 Tax=Talaromyces proteolyticus TaxID=1131652 RepID=A0AAD4KI32_9EURO|nr:uncharacterized protein BGW36DRAFT_402030 [Talaromyces proteolyticus]KAH8688958.1 hypothetical protein BGW36DRAFT_402030 [Talaromyces proteolyticus]
MDKNLSPRRSQAKSSGEIYIRRDNNVDSYSARSVESGGTICVGDIIAKGFADLEASIAKINAYTKLYCRILEVSSVESVDNWIGDIVAKFGDQNGAANVTSVPQAIGDWSHILKINFDVMKDLPAGNRAIVNLASMPSLQHNPDAYAYHTSKAACAHFTTSVAKNTNRLGIGINCFSPVHMDPEDVGRVIVWLLLEESMPVYGSNMKVGAGLPWFVSS